MANEIGFLPPPAFSTPPEQVEGSLRGEVLALRSSVVDVGFAHSLPELYTRLDVSGDPAIVLEVVSQLDAHTVRAIALTPTTGLARGMAVISAGQPLRVPVGDRLLGRVFNVFGQPIDGLGAVTGGNGDPSTNDLRPLPNSPPRRKFYPRALR
jgi:F0F1-type ATP synthase beta subunit